MAAGGTGVYGAATGVAACGMLWYMPWLTRRSLFSAMIVTLARICANTNRNSCRFYAFLCACPVFAARSVG